MSGYRYVNMSNIPLKKRKTDEEFIQAVKESTSIRQALEKLELCSNGGNYDSFNRRLKRLNIDITHFKPSWESRQPTTYAPKKSLDELLKNNSPTQSYRLGKRLIQAKKLINECSICSLTNWLDKPISLHLDHINGINSDNRIENLRLLCPNCHSQTPTYAGKNKKKYNYELKKYFCLDCNSVTNGKTKTGRCHKCVKKFVRKRKLEKLNDVI